MPLGDGIDNASELTLAGSRTRAQDLASFDQVFVIH